MQSERLIAFADSVAHRTINSHLESHRGNSPNSDTSSTLLLHAPQLSPTEQGTARFAPLDRDPMKDFPFEALGDMTWPREAMWRRRPWRSAEADVPRDGMRDALEYKQLSYTWWYL